MLLLSTDGQNPNKILCVRQTSRQRMYLVVNLPNGYLVCFLVKLARDFVNARHSPWQLTTVPGHKLQYTHTPIL